jgi:glycosyltransferase involved in cell wall biosynthesis
MLDPWSLSQGALKKKLYLALRLRRHLNRAAAVHFTTPVERDLVRPLGLKAPAIVEPIGVDLAEFAPLPPRGAFRARFAQIGDRPVVIFLGRLHRKKGLDLLIPAFARAAIHDAVLVLAGPDDGNYRPIVERMIEAERIGSQVIFVGMLHGRQRIEALVDSELFVLPSYQENFGIAVVEALAAGVPVIISDQVNIHQEVREAGGGSVVPLRAEAICTELVRWMADKNLRRQAGERGQTLVRERYDWSRIARNWFEHYALICGREARR